MKFILCFLSGLVFCTRTVAQNEIRIAGKIISAHDGRGIEGVSVMATDSKNAALSSPDGTFSIVAGKKDTLVISHISYIKQIVCVDTLTGGFVTISLVNKAIGMDEVVVSTGYEDLRKKLTTGSYEKIDNDLLNRSTGISILSRLDGVAGSLIFDKRPSSDAPIRIRGISTLGNASTSPLIVVDNFPYEDNIENINPADVESVTILKDAAASAIWGARAGNGVIVITTKKSQYNHPLRISFNSSLTITPRPDLFSERSISPSDYIDVEEYLFSQGFYDFSLDNPYYFPPLSPVVNLLGEERSGLITQAAADSQINVMKTHDVRSDFEKYLYRPASLQQYHLNVSGGDKVIKYFLSGGFDKNLGNLLGDQMQRFTLRSDNSFTPFKNLEVDLSVSYTNTQTVNNSPGGYHSVLIGATGADLYPYLNLADGSGNPVFFDYVYSHTFTDTAGNGKLLNWQYNPIDELHHTNRTASTDALVLDLGLKYTITKALKAEIKSQYQHTPGIANTDYDINSFQARNLINQFTQIVGTNAEYIVPYGGILDRYQTGFSGKAVRGQLNFAKQFGEKHFFNAIAGGEIRQTGTDFFSSRLYGYDKDHLGFSLVDYTNAYPTFDDVLGNIFIPTNDALGSQLNRYVSVYSNASYSFKSRYVLSASFRKDASNLFGVNSNQKGTPLWSVGTSWNISDEPFYKSDLLPFLKLRATYGYSGNVSYTVSALPTLGFYPASSQPLTGLPFSIISNYPNPDLQWEKVGMFNLGIDFSFTNDRVSGSIEFYSKRSSNLLGFEPLDPTGGALSITTNSADMKGSGIDINLNSKNITNKNFRWETQFLFSSAKNKVIKYLKSINTAGYTSDGAFISPMPGYEPYLIVAYKYAGLNSQGLPLGFINGKVSDNYDSIRYYTPLQDQAIMGSAIPLVFGSMRNTFRWKEVSLSFNITYKFDYYFRKPSISYYDLFYNNRGTSDFANRWQQPGDEKKTTIPALTYPLNSKADNFYQYADINVLNGSHIRFEDVRISYQLPLPAASKLSIRGLSLFVYLNNLNILLWKSNKENIDPEFPTGLKTPINVSFGIQADF